MGYKISQVYNIAKTIISDPTFKVSKLVYTDLTKYSFEKQDLSMNIYAPHCNNNFYDDYDDKTGSIVINYKNNTIYAITKHNIERAMTRSRLNPISIFTRLRAPLFFHLIDMAEKRNLNQTERIHHKISTLREKIH